MSSELRDLYQEVVIDHSKKPRNFRKPEGANRSAEGINPLCGDQITLYLKLSGDVIEDIGFQGAGCAISKASASLMTAALKNQIINLRRPSAKKASFNRIKDNAVTTTQAEVKSVEPKANPRAIEKGGVQNFTNVSEQSRSPTNSEASCKDLKSFHAAVQRSGTVEL